MRATAAPRVALAATPPTKSLGSGSAPAGAGVQFFSSAAAAEEGTAATPRTDDDDHHISITSAHIASAMGAREEEEGRRRVEPQKETAIGRPRQL